MFSEIRALEDRDNDRGFILITFGLLLIPIVVFMALAVDVSSWYSRASELQRTADAAALAGVVWMPDQGAADNAANPVLARNQVTNGTDNMTVTTSTGTKAASYKVCVTDGKVTQFFASVFAGSTSITRCATAEYNAPLQMGSPLNFFGGNSSLTAYVPGTQPSNAGPPVPPYSQFKVGSSYASRCIARASYPSGAIVGYWNREGSNNPNNFRFYTTYPGTGFPNCNQPAPAVPDVESTDGSYCYVVAGGNPIGYWYKYTSGSFPDAWRYRGNGSSGNPTCGYNGTSNSPIPTSKSPNMWAAIESYNYGHANGDAYSNSGSQYRDTGYWYAVDVPPGMNSSLSIQAWDLTYNCNLGCRTPMGDTSGGSDPMDIKMVVYKAGPLKYDMSQISAVSGCDTGWVNANDSAYDTRWKSVCDITSATSGDRYYINVLSTDSSGHGTGLKGVTGYAVRAVAGTYPAACMNVMPTGDVACYGTGVQPSLSAYGDMEMYNGIPEGQPTEFYLANVTPEYAGKTLEINLFDPGDIGDGGDSWVTIMGPSGSSTLGTPISSSNCDVASANYGPGTYSSAPLSSGPSGAYSGTCTIQTSNGGSNAYNDKWLRFRIKLPADYGATSGSQPCIASVADPTVTPGSCWWQVKYYTRNASLNDYTTWSARIIGDPVRLTM